MKILKTVRWINSKLAEFLLWRADVRNSVARNLIDGGDRLVAEAERAREKGRDKAAELAIEAVELAREAKKLGG